MSPQPFAFYSGLRLDPLNDSHAERIFPIAQETIGTPNNPWIGSRNL
jgi:hypothetical protein